MLLLYSVARTPDIDARPIDESRLISMLGDKEYLVPNFTAGWKADPIMITTVLHGLL